MVVATADGSKVSIQKVDDDKYCKKIANAMKLQARFKTSGRVIKKQKTGEYNFWSVVSLIVDSMAKEEELAFSEGILDTIKNKVKGFFSGIYQKAKDYIQSGVSKLMKFLGATPDIQVKRFIRF